MSRNQRATDNKTDDKQAARRSARRETAGPAQVGGTAAGARLPEGPGAASPASLLALQGRVGNRAVQQMLATRQVQAKLDVGAVDDPLERQADQAAEQVMRAPSSGEQDQPAAGPVEEE